MKSYTKLPSRAFTPSLARQGYGNAAVVRRSPTRDAAPHGPCPIPGTWDRPAPAEGKVDVADFCIQMELHESAPAHAGRQWVPRSTMRRSVQVHRRLTDAESEKVPSVYGSQILELLEQYGVGPCPRAAETRAVETHYQRS